ncbi:hypothetical protein FQR65_LT18388 [Abscondita terminalis]|nr:hypothetical protein FQR65_LT18388 [Abscondita terminalis]
MKCFINYPENCDFPIQNLPYGVFSTKSNLNKRIGVAIGDKILDLSLISHLFDGPVLRCRQDVFKESTLNSFMALGLEAWKEARLKLQYLLSDERSNLIKDVDLFSKAIVLQSDSTMHLPARIGDYSDFFNSLYHAVNCGKAFLGLKGDHLLPNWKRMPLAYHGRASSIVVSGTPITRPFGQFLGGDAAVSSFGPCQCMDFEVELAFFIGGPPTQLGERITMQETEKHIFGFVLLNDWSARDIQKWESTPLGPFNSKNVGTSISPWVVTTLALEPFIVDNFVQNPVPPNYLQHHDNCNYDIKLQVDLIPEDSGVKSTICKTNYKYQYWSHKQTLVQHTVGGCNVNPGDLMAIGTISGPTPDSYGSIIELTEGTKKPVKLVDGGERLVLEDGDTIILKGVCEGIGYNVGFGECVGKLLPSKPY